MSAPTLPVNSAPAANNAPVDSRGPAAGSMAGLPWFIVGGTLMIVAFMQAVRIPEMMQYKSSDAVVGNLTGIVAQLGIAAALVAVGFMKRRQSR